MENDEIKAAQAVAHHGLVLPLQAEKWECRACGIEAPCKVEIVFSDAKLPEHLKGNQRFRRMVCLCEEKRPDWKRVHDGQNA